MLDNNIKLCNTTIVVKKKGVELKKILYFFAIIILFTSCRQNIISNDELSNILKRANNYKEYGLNQREILNAIELTPNDYYIEEEYNEYSLEMTIFNKLVIVRLNFNNSFEAEKVKKSLLNIINKEYNLKEKIESEGSITCYLNNGTDIRIERPIYGELQFTVKKSIFNY
jgi:hypothetical protein